MKKINLLTKSMGTVCEVILFVPDEMEYSAKKCANSIREYLFDADDRLSVFKADSEISKLNSTGRKNGVLLSPDTFEILKLSKQYHSQTNGLFDITVGKFSEDRRQGIIYPPLRKKIKKSSLEPFSLNENEKSAILNNEEILIDLGGIAKGYAADRIVNMIRSAGINKAIINLGGTVAVVGTKEKVGIRNPFVPINRTGIETAFAYILCENETIVTSGIYEQSTDEEMIYHHIIDPRTGKPCKTDLLSATVISKFGAKADAFATALIVLALRKAIKFSKKNNLSVILTNRTKEEPKW